MNDPLNADFSKRIVVDTAVEPWQPSPSPTVWRKRLDRVGPAEAGRVTSLVRYDLDATFPAHDHPDGEEIFVVDGVFSDERGDFGAGTFMMNPEGFRHAPRSGPGCTLFVKLRQYGGERPTVLLDTTVGTFRPVGIVGVESMVLYESIELRESVRLTRFAPKTGTPEIEIPEGEEIFVLDGQLSDENGDYSRGTWIRMPKGSRHTPSSAGGCTLYVKKGGFPDTV